jgi:hypothetical protein
MSFFRKKNPQPPQPQQQPPIVGPSASAALAQMSKDAQPQQAPRPAQNGAPPEQ